MYIFFLMLLMFFASTAEASNVIVIVWDGLRPDSITQKNTPNLYHLMQAGTVFQDHHSTFPTVTMINATSLATGNYPDITGFFGNTIWQPKVFSQPVFMDDEKILQQFSKHNIKLSNSLFEIAKQYHIKTAFMGNAGAGYLFSPSFTGINEPKPAELDYLEDGVTPNPLSSRGVTYQNRDQYFTEKFINQILHSKPQLAFLWLAEPDGTQHDYSFGTPNYFSALKHNDAILGEIKKTMDNLGLTPTTNLLILSDHGQSFISGPLQDFPLDRKLKSSLSGDIRTADLLTKAGFTAYDGEGCRYDPIMSGVTKQNKPLYSFLVDLTGKVCGKAQQKYTSPSYLVPEKLPLDAVIIATNSSSVYFYIPSHNVILVKTLIRFLQTHEPFGAIFLDTKRYPLFPGTLSLKSIHLSAKDNSPDLIVSLNFNTRESINGIKGTAFCDYPNERGTHGSFSPFDVHSFFIAIGPDFRKKFIDELPTANVDIAPTIANILKIPFSNRAGRVLSEALVTQKPDDISLTNHVLRSETAQHLSFINAANKPITGSHYHIDLHYKQLTIHKKRFFYFDKAEAVRN